MDGLEILKNPDGGGARLKIIIIQCILQRIFVSLEKFFFLKCLQAIYFSFYIKYAMENGEILGTFFFEMCTIQTVLNMSRLSTGVSFTYRMSN